MFRSRATDDSGVVAVIVALLVVVFVMFTALVVDVGYWYNTKRQLQAAADAAALAGCWELADGQSNAAIWGKVTDYANRNAVTPVSTVGVLPPSPGGLSDITNDYVKVTLETPGSVFFSGIFNSGSPTIRAQSVARVGYLVGAHTPVPWALPIMRVNRMVAKVGGVEYDLTLDSDGNYSGMLPTGWAGDVSIIAYNSQTLDPAYPNGVPQIIGNAGRALYIPTTSKFADIRLDKNCVTAGYGQTVGVEVFVKAPLATGEGVQVNVGTTKHALVNDPLNPLRYTANISVGTTDDLWATRTLEFSVVQGGKTIEALSGTQTIVIRRSTNPIGNVRIEPTVFPAGSPGMSVVTVKVNDYEYGNLYELKVNGGAAEVGNFMAVDFHQTHHTPYWRQQDPIEYSTAPWGGPDYLSFIEGVIPRTYDDYILHVGDTIWTQPGAGSAPQIESALDRRFASGDRVIVVPITETIQQSGGVTALRVVSFAAFEVVDVDRGNITGRFIEYVTSGWVVDDDPPDPNYAVKVAHLTAENVDF